MSDAGRCDSLPTRRRFSRPVRFSSIAAYWPARPMMFRTRCGCARTSSPSTLAVPSSGRARVVSIRTTVVFPAPLGPSSPRTRPSGTSKETPRTASTSPKHLTRPSATIAGAPPFVGVSFITAPDPTRATSGYRPVMPERAQTDANRDLVRRFWDDLYRKDFDACGAAFADDGVYTDVPVGEQGATGPAEVAARLRLGLEPITGYVHIL